MEKTIRGLSCGFRVRLWPATPAFHTGEKEGRKEESKEGTEGGREKGEKEEVRRK